MSDTSDRPTFPRAIIHKRILDVAADQPDASLDAIADKIPSASPDLVERVLNEYGDPAEDNLDDPPDTDDAAMDQEADYPDPADLSDKQRETLRVIYKHPEASQRDIGDILNVSGATVSTCVNSIAGFDWADRRAFTHAVFDTATASEDPDHMKSNETEHKAAIEKLRERVNAIEQRIEDVADVNEANSNSGFEAPELTHKVVHACMESNNITEDEELQILKKLL